MNWNFNMQQAPGDGTEIVGINKAGEVRKIRYTTYDEKSPGYQEGRRRYFWRYVSDNDYLRDFEPVAWIALPPAEALT